MLLPQTKSFEQRIEEKSVNLYILKCGKITAAITNYGARIVSLIVPDKNGNAVDVIVGPGTIQDYLDCKEPYYGAAIGRYANRIAKGKFSLEGKGYQLPVNNGVNHLHGGIKGFHNVVWDVINVTDSEIELRYLSKDGEEGYPGNLDVKLVYTVTEDNALRFSFEATTDKTTVCNFTNHAFFNLNGCGSGTINNHLLQLNSDYYLPVDKNQIPTGKIESVSETVFDFKQTHIVGSRLVPKTGVGMTGQDAEQLKYGAGYDNCFVINKEPGTDLVLAAIATGDISLVEMKVYTQEPGIQFYGGNFMNGTNKIKGGGKDLYRTSFALETQHFPDSPNQLHFPSTILKPGNAYRTTTKYQFGAERQ
jgi:aldose 1-epimerase